MRDVRERAEDAGAILAARSCHVERFAEHAFGVDERARDRERFAELPAENEHRAHRIVELAAEQFAAIAQDGSVDKALKDLAAVLGGLAFLDAGKPEDAAKLVEPLTGDNEPYRYSALEVQAQAALAGGDKAKAKKLYEQLKQLSALPNAPQGVSARAEIMLQRLQD